MIAKRHTWTALALGIALCTSCNQSDKPAPPASTVATPAAASSPAIVATPLPAPAASTSETLFEQLAASATGVDFVNPIQTTHPMKFLYASAMGCGGVAVGDFDNDGRPDLYFTGGARPNALYRQMAALKFEDVTATAKVDGRGAWSTGAAMVDIDNDGDLDIYVCNYEAPNQLYLNDGKGVFSESARKFGLEFQSAGHTPAFCDFDSDGDLDLYLMTNMFYDPRGKQPSTSIVEVERGQPRVQPRFQKYYQIVKTTKSDDGQFNVEHDSVGQPDRFVVNNGDGTFTETKMPGQFPGKGNAAVWWDPDGDGSPDLYLANDFKDRDAYFENAGGGKFSEVIRDRVPHTTWFSMGADSNDLDGDGRPDMMVADMSGTNHFKQKVGMGAMSASAEFLTTAVPRQYMRNTVYLNPGGGRLQETAHMAGLANSDWTWTVRLSDFDNDGKVDVFLTNGMAINLNVADNAAAVNALPGETEWDKHIRAGTPQLKEQNLAFRNRGDLEFDNVSEAWGLDHVGMSYGATAADLDRDGDLEIIVANLEEPIGIYQNHSKEANRILVELRGTENNKRGLGATVTVKTANALHTRFLSLNRGYMASGEAVMHFGLGAEEQIEKLTVRWPGGTEQSFASLDANQHFVITESGASPATTEEVTPHFAAMPSSLTSLAHTETEYDDYERQPLLPHKHSQLGPGLALGDIDGDGDDDLFAGGAKGQAGRLMRNAGGGKFEAVACPALDGHKDSEDMGAVFFDADGDGDLDLYVASGGVECEPGDASLRDRLYLNDGTGTFAAIDALPDLRDSSSTVSASDFDADGDLDLFVGGRIIPGSYPLSAQSRILRNTNATFTDATKEVAPELGESGLVTSALWSDANGDGRSDLLVTYEWGPVRLFANNDGKLTDVTAQTGIDWLTGWWNGIAGGDVDGDGDIDYAVTNLGLNTKYHCSFEKPMYIYAGDFDGTGTMHLIEAEYEDDILYPMRGRSCSSHAMPFLLDKFETYEKFALSSLTEIYTPDTLKSAREFKATELSSGILRNDGEGHFEFEPLPRIAQIAPGFGAEFMDVDGDGNLDLYLAQNFYSPQPETGRMAGGVSQLLRGRGDGTFEIISPAQSGLVVPGDAKSLVRTDLDGDGRQDFIVGVNDAPARVFRNQTTGESLSVSLAGMPGNPAGIGARVTVTTRDRQQTAEIYAGSGYLSQSSATLAFNWGSDATIAVRWPDGKTSTASGAEKSIKIPYPE